jgi:hypothetical protein
MDVLCLLRQPADRPDELPEVVTKERVGRNRDFMVSVEKRLIVLKNSVWIWGFCGTTAAGLGNW